MPARTCSLTRAAVKRPRPMTAGTNDAQGGVIDLIHPPIAFGNSSGNTKYHRNNWTSSGMFRNNSTYALPILTAHLFGVVRMTPSADPSSNAMMPAHSAVVRVHPRPTKSVVSHVWRPSADISKNIFQFQL